MLTVAVLQREAEAELSKTGGDLASVVHQRVAFPDAASRGESLFMSAAIESAPPTSSTRSVPERWEAWV
jgi:hypothetical protein